MGCVATWVLLGGQRCVLPYHTEEPPFTWDLKFLPPSSSCDMNKQHPSQVVTWIPARVS